MPPGRLQELLQEQDANGFIEQPISMLGGVNLLNDPRAIADDECVQTKNCYPVTPGIMSKRGGLGFVSNPSIAALAGPLSFSPAGAYPFAAASPSFQCPYDILACLYDATGGNNGVGNPALSIIIFDNAGTISTATQITDVNLSGVKTGMPVPPLIRPWIFSFGTTQYLLFGSNVHTYPGVTVSKTSANPVANGNYSQTANGVSIQPLQWMCKDGSLSPNTAFPTVACAYRSRVAWANLGPGFERYIVFSDNFLPNQIAAPGVDPVAANGRALQIGKSGDIIIALAEVMLTQTGGPPNSALLVLCQNSAYLVTGEPNQTTDQQALTPLTGTLQVAQVSYNCGCVSPWTIARTPYGIIWCGPDDVWMFQFGQGPVRIGTKIRPAILRNPPSMLYKMTAAYSQGIYRLMCAGDGQGVQDSDPLQDQWYLDLRDGAPQGVIGENAPSETAKWFGPMQFVGGISGDTPAKITVGTRLFIQDSRPYKNPNLLYGLEQGIFQVEASFSLVLYDTTDDHDLLFSPVDSLFHFQSIADVPISLSGVQYQASILTKRYHFGIPRLQKIFDSLALAIGNNETMQLAVDIIFDDGITIDTLTKDPLSQGLILGVGSLDVQVMSDNSQAILLQDLSRNNGYTIQLRIYDNQGIDIQSDANVIAFMYGGVLKIATIASQLYSDIVALSNAIIIAMNLAVGANIFTHNQGTNPRNAYPSITSSGATWFFDFVGSNGTAAQALTTSKLGATLGYATNVNAAPALTRGAEQSVTAGTAAPPWATVNPLFTLEDLQLRYIIVPRPPT